MPRPLPDRISPPNQVRIIGGRLRRRLLRFPADADLRPTPDRVRETLFNWLGQELDGLATLDLFAGSGALSFEALSRGATLAVAVESSRPAAAALRDNAAVLSTSGLEVHCGDALAFLKRESRGFDLIFLDPPFREAWLDRLWSQVEARLNPGGWLYVEQAHLVVPPPGWEVFRQQRAGQVHYHLLRRAAAAAAPDDAQRKPTL